MKKTSPLKIIGFIILGLLVIGILLAIGAVMWYKMMLKPVNPAECEKDCGDVSFVIADGAATAAIANKLEEQHLIQSALAFRAYMKLEGKELSLKTGEYTLNPHMSVQDIVERFNKGAMAKTFRITFLPGGTVAQAKEAIKKQGYSDEAIEAAFNQTYDHELLKSKPVGTSLEGYIYGETYEFYADATVEDILKRTFDEMYKVVKENDLVNKYKAQGLTLHEGITLASVVQRESGTLPAEMPHVAQVFLLRLKKGMVLGSDAIIGYRADQLNPNRSKTDMSYLNTISCPWNSRKCAGLPPTPISAPGKGAMLAVANPTNTQDLYFLTGDDNKMYYATNEAGHKANIKNHCKEMCKLL